MKQISRTYHLFDAKGKILGRLATEIAIVLSGKNKVDYTPHIDGGDFVVVINSDAIEVSGEKEKKKMYHSYSGYPGGLKSATFEKLMEIDSRLIIESAVYGMLPSNKLRAPRMKRLHIYTDDQHPHTTIHTIHE